MGAVRWATSMMQLRNRDRAGFEICERRSQIVSTGEDWVRWTMGPISCSLRRRAGFIVGTVMIAAMVAVPAAQALTAAAGVQFSGVVDYASCVPTAAPAINWGDGTTSAGTYDTTSNNVSGSHTYAAAGSFSGTVTLACATAPATDIFTATVAPAPQFTQCPPVNVDYGCQFLITVSGTGTTIQQDINQGPYESAEDALIGVQNNSSNPVSSFPLAAPGSSLFGFEGDGICNPGGLPIPSGCVPPPGSPAGTTCIGSNACSFPPPPGQPAGYTEPGAPAGNTQNGYEGPTTWYSNVSADTTSGQVNFSPALQPGQSTYFSLEEPPVNGLAAGATPSGVSFSRPPVVTNTGASFSGLVNPNGSVTTAYFQYGLDSRYYTPGTSGPVYSATTPAQSIGGDFSAHSVLATVSGLVPHALYHVRLVATNKDGTTFGADQTYLTNQDRAPGPPALGKTENVVPLSGIIYIKPPAGKAFSAIANVSASNPLLKGHGFVPLTEARQIPLGSQIDARRGTLKLITATGARGRHSARAQTGVFGGGLFKAAQARGGIAKGLTTLTLVENAFPGAPSYSRCHVGKALAAHAARSNPILQTLHARDSHGRFRTKGRYSAGTVRGTIWDTTEECAGTLTTVHRGTVAVYDYGKRRTIAVHAGHSYLAKARHK